MISIWHILTVLNRDKNIPSRIGIKTLLILCVSICSAFQAKADNEDNIFSKANYADSIRNDNTVYSEKEASSLLHYLQQLKGAVPDDSLRLYVTEGLINYTWYLMDQREWFICRWLVNKAKEYCPASNYSLIHQINTAMAGILLFNGNYPEAGKLIHDANNYFKNTKDTGEWLKSCVNLGVFYSRTHNKPKALEYYGKVLETAQGNKQYENYYSIVAGYAENVEVDSIINLETFENALRISQKNGYTFLLATNYNDLANYYFRMGDYNEAMNNAKNALKYAERFNQNELCISALSIMADIFYITKNYVAAYNMETQKFAALKKSNDDKGKRIYSHLCYADSLINWVDLNIPPCHSATGNAASTDHNGTSISLISLFIICVAIIISSIIIVICVGKRNRTIEKCNHRQENEEPPVTTGNDATGIIAGNSGTSEPENSTHEFETTFKIDADATKATSASTKGAAALTIIAESFNPMLDRIRNELKEIPKTGDTNIDSKIRNIINKLIQSRLPDSDNELIKSMKTDGADFASRLHISYPELTKNDIRMAQYIRSGLNAHEISAISGLQSKSVNQARYRLRKSLGLGQDDSLESFIMAF